MSQLPHARWSVVVCSAMAVGLVAVIAIYYAAPFLDGDLFWQMAYARQMISHGTLRLDHTVFSWTPASNQIIYCAWASELILFGLWNHAGVWSLFALRYAVILFVIWLLWDNARRWQLAAWPATYFVLLVAAISVSAGTVIKPELFSLMFMSLAVWAFFRGRQAAWQGLSPVKWFYLVPVLVMLWVNFHGAFILFAPFLFATAAGEGLIIACSQVKTMTPRAYGHLLMAWGLCGLAPLVNPYGLRYPVQLFQDYVLCQQPRPDAAWNLAMRSIFTAAEPGLDYLKLGLAMTGLLAGVFIMRTLAAPRRRISLDFTFLLSNLAYMPLFISYLRSTWCWVPVFANCFFFAAGQARAWQLKNNSPGRCLNLWEKTRLALAVVAFVSLSTLAVWTAWRHPISRSWAGFGNSYRNPVPEAEFLEASKLPPRLINLFDSGGYLLWRLWPQYRVMTDQRSFPYLSWFKEQQAFTLGRNFDGFIATHSADTAVIDLEQRCVWQQFLRAHDWQLAYYGPTAAIFVRNSVSPGQLAINVAPERFNHIKNAEVAFRVFCFATAVADYRTAWQVEEQLQTELRFQTDPEELCASQKYRAAHQALRERQFDKALPLFRSAFVEMGFSDRDWQIEVDLCRLTQINQKIFSGNGATYRAELVELAAPQ